ncbi:HNH endonuclease [Vineibacter terrae]|uniref:HNH endonuclease n=1 Tax=Vineibacter terrae TaxID=2586908 RepID=A0A5C8PS57_9HYPH|nr:HNH endonuclease [Vineibacter terrae]
MVDTIGNLTLLTAAMDTAMSNAPWPTKRQWLKDHGLQIVMNHKLVEVNDRSEDAILARSVALADVAVRLWSRPSGAIDQTA